MREKWVRSTEKEGAAQKKKAGKSNNVIPRTRGTHRGGRILE